MNISFLKEHIYIKNTARNVVLVNVLIILSGCSSIPDVTARYYQTQTQYTIKATRTVSCDDNNTVHSILTVSPTAEYFADLNSQKEIKLSNLNGVFTDSDIEFQLYDDGRLKSINGTQTGQGDKIIKAAATVAATLGAFSTNEPHLQPQGKCAFIKKIGGGKPITLAYEKIVDFMSPTNEEIEPDATSLPNARRLSVQVPPLCVRTRRMGGTAKPPVGYLERKGDVVITARQPAIYDVIIGLKKGESCDEELWHGKATVSQMGLEYQLPIPKAVLFGTQTLEATFADSGALQKLQYGNNSGSSEALGAANTVIIVAQGESKSE